MCGVREMCVRGEGNVCSVSLPSELDTLLGDTQCDIIGESPATCGKRRPIFVSVASK